MTRQVTYQGLQAAAPPPEAVPPALLQPPEAAPPALLQPPELAPQLGLGLTDHAASSLEGNSSLLPNCLGLHQHAVKPKPACLVSSIPECAIVLQASQGTCAGTCLQQHFVHCWLVVFTRHNFYDNSCRVESHSAPSALREEEELTG